MATSVVRLDETDASRLQATFVRLARFVGAQNPSGLPMTVASVFAVVAEGAEPTLSALAEIEGVARPTITRVVGDLEQLGLVERIADSADGRVSRVRLTPRGAEQHRLWRADYLRWFNQKLARLPVHERASLVGAIDALEHLASGIRSE
jgi:DNA-binding MarR family transcriptional regulator